MSVKFISYVDQNEKEEWFIKLTDTLGKKDIMCKNLDEFQEHIETMGMEYGGDIEVVWKKSNTLTPKNYQDIMNKMAKLQDEYENEINTINTQNNGGFNPNA